MWHRPQAISSVACAGPGPAAGMACRSDSIFFAGVGRHRLPRRQALQSAIHPDQECAMPVDDIEGIRRILSSYKTVAMVGLSANWHRPSNFAAKYLLDHGFRVIPRSEEHTSELQS